MVIILVIGVISSEAPKDTVHGERSEIERLGGSLPSGSCLRYDPSTEKSEWFQNTYEYQANRGP